MRYPNCTANLTGVGVVLRMILLNLPPACRVSTQWVRIEPYSCREACCAIAMSGCHFIHIYRRLCFFIIAGRIIWINRSLTRFRSHCVGDEVVDPYSPGFNDWQTSMFGILFILHILQKHNQQWGRIRSLVFSIDIDCLVPLPKRLQLLQRMKEVCCYEKHTHRWSDFSTILGKLVSCIVHGEV